MNFTGEYNDDIDGDFLACKPGNIAEGLENICTIGMPIIGYAILLNGLWLFYLVYIQRCHRKLLELLVKQTRDAACVSNVQNIQDPFKIHPQTDSTAAAVTFSYIEKLVLSLGVATVFLALLFLVHGAGTKYPTTQIRGQIGDAVGAIMFAALWYQSLLAHRGAIYFKSSIPQPKGSLSQKTATTTRFKLPSLSTILNTMQSWLAPLIALLVWAFLRAGVYTRGWYFFIMFSLQCACGLRTFVAIVFQRLSTLRRVALMVNAKRSGTREEAARRNGFMISKMISVFLDLTIVFCLSVLLSASYLILGSTSNSRQFAIHAIVHGALHVMFGTFNCIHLHFSFKKLKRKSGRRSTKKKSCDKNAKVNPDVVPSEVMSSSVAMQSDV